MLPDLEDWTIADVRDLARAEVDESLTLEKKASAKLDTSDKAKKREALSELAKHVCAFSNAGGGFVLYGVNDAKAGGGLDGGVERNVGKQPVEDWITSIIPELVRPAVTECRARFIPFTSTTDRGAVVVWIPASFGRPHWVEEDNRALPYLRVDKHSAPMSLQTFLDIHSRGVAPSAQIDDLEHWLVEPAAEKSELWLCPSVMIVSGPMCERWAVEVETNHGVSTMSPTHETIKLISANRAIIHGEEPLYPRRHTRPLPKMKMLQISLQEPSLIFTDEPVTFSLFAGSSPPVTRKFPMQRLFSGKINR